MGSANAEACAISVDGLELGYGRSVVLRDISLSLSVGCTVLAGPNGHGKSTLLRALATLHRPTAGSIVSRGEALDSRTSVSQYRSEVGYLAQGANFPARFSPRDALTYACWLHQVPRATSHEVVERQLATYGLEGESETPLGRLSGGMRRRAEIAIATAHAPDVVLLDEPSAGLDVEGRLHLREHLRAISRAHTLVVVTHDLDDLWSLADALVIVAHGGLGYVGTKAQLRAEVDSREGLEPFLARYSRERPGEGAPDTAR